MHPTTPTTPARDPGTADDGPSSTITDAVLAWPGVTAATGSRGEWAFTVGRREIGHLHGDRIAHFGFPKRVWHELHDAGRIDYHPVFPGKPGFAERRIAGPDDVADVVALLRINYDRTADRDAPAES